MDSIREKQRRTSAPMVHDDADDMIPMGHQLAHASTVATEATYVNDGEDGMALGQGHKRMILRPIAKLFAKSSNKNASTETTMEATDVLMEESASSSAVSCQNSVMSGMMHALHVGSVVAHVHTSPMQEEPPPLVPPKDQEEPPAYHAIVSASTPARTLTRRSKPLPPEPISKALHRAQGKQVQPTEILDISALSLPAKMCWEAVERKMKRKRASDDETQVGSMLSSSATLSRHPSLNLFIPKRPMATYTSLDAIQQCMMDVERVLRDIHPNDVMYKRLDALHHVLAGPTIGEMDDVEVDISVF